MLHRLITEKKTKCFYGTEAEGPHRGALVFFIPASVHFYDASKALERMLGKGLSPQRIYYGAGNDRMSWKTPSYLYYNLSTLLAVVSLGYRIEIDIEYESMIGVDITPWLHTKLSINPTDVDRADYIKTFTDEEIVWTGKDGSVFRTRYDDPLFSQDSYI